MDIYPFENRLQTQSNTPQCLNIPFLPDNPKLAHAYVPFQSLNTVYPPMQGLENGTIFPELDQPYGADIIDTLDA